MQWLQRLLPKLLVLGAIGVIAVALFSDKKAEYGSVTLPRGGDVTLPEGTVNVFVDEDTTVGAVEDGDHNLPDVLSFAAVPVSGGDAVTPEPATDSGGPGEVTQRSEGIGARGTVATLDVPEHGDYRIAGSMGDSPAELTFGLTAFRSVAHEWKLIAGLLVGALLISMVRVPKRSRGEDVEFAAEPRPVAPYRG